MPAGVLGAWEWPEASLEEGAASQAALWGPVTDSHLAGGERGAFGCSGEADWEPKRLNPARPGRVTREGGQLRVLKKAAALASFGYPSVSLKPSRCEDRA